MVVRSLLKLLAAFLVAGLVFVLILGVVSFVALRKFDLNQFRGEFEKYIATQSGLRVDLGDIKLRWRPQPQIQVEGIKFYHPVRFEKILQSNQIRINLDLTSIWMKRFGMSQALIQSPDFFVKRNKGGLWNWQQDKNAEVPAALPPIQAPLNPVAAEEVSDTTAPPSAKRIPLIAQGWVLGIGKIKFLNATAHFADETFRPPIRLDLGKIDAEVSQKALPSLFHFEAGGVVFGTVATNFDAKGDLDVFSRTLDFALRYGPEKMQLKGKLRLTKALPHFEGDLDVHDLDMESVLPEAYKQGDYVSGRLNTNDQLSFEGTDPDRIQLTLAGQGSLDIKDGALRNRNLIKEIFDRLSPVLAIANSLGGELPPEVSEMLKGRDTPFQSLQGTYSVQSGVFNISKLQLQHPNYQLSGNGSYGMLDKRVEGTMQLVLSKSISGYLMKKINELTFLADPAGQIVIPFRYGGVFPNASVQPDLPNIASRLLQGGTQQLLSHGLEGISKVLSPKKSVKNSANETTAPKNAEPDEPVSEKDKLIQQGMALLSKYQAAEKASPTADTPAAFPRSSVPIPPEEQAASSEKTSEKDQLIQQGLALLTKYRETENQ